MSTSKDILFCHLFHYKEHIFVAGNTKKNKQTRQKHASGQSNKWRQRSMGIHRGFSDVFCRYGRAFELTSIQNYKVYMKYAPWSFLSHEFILKLEKNLIFR